MTQSGQAQSQERKFIAVSFRGVQQASRERTAMVIAGEAALEVMALPARPLPEPVELEEGATERPPLGAPGEVSFALGGEGARAAYAYAAHHGLVTLSTTVGADAAGDLIVRWLSDRGAGVELVRRAGRTPVRVLLAPPGYQATSIGSEASELDAALDPAAALGGRGTLLLAGYPYTGPLRGEGGAAVLRRAREQRITTVLSLAPVAIGGAGRPLTPEDLEPLLPHIDLLCGGPAELRRATRRADPQEAARALIQGGVKEVLAKRGGAGAAIFRMGPYALERADSPTPAAASALGSGTNPVRVAAAFGAVYDASYLLGMALNDADPMRFAASIATRVALSPEGVLAL